MFCSKVSDMLQLGEGKGESYVNKYVRVMLQ